MFGFGGNCTYTVVNVDFTLGPIRLRTGSMLLNLKRPTTYCSDDLGSDATKPSPPRTTNTWRLSRKEEGSTSIPWDLHSKRRDPPFRGSIFWWTRQGERSYPTQASRRSSTRIGGPCRQEVELDNSAHTSTRHPWPFKQKRLNNKKRVCRRMTVLGKSIWSMELRPTSYDNLWAQAFFGVWAP